MNAWDYEEVIDFAEFSAGMLEDPQAPYGEGKKESRDEFIRQQKNAQKLPLQKL